MSLPHGGAWIETGAESNAARLNRSRSLTGERGLKQIVDAVPAGSIQVAPSRGSVD